MSVRVSSEAAPLPLPFPSTINLSIPRGPSVVRIASTTAPHAVMFDSNCPFPCDVSVPSFSTITCGLYPPHHQLCHSVMVQPWFSPCQSPCIRYSPLAYHHCRRHFLSCGFRVLLASCRVLLLATAVLLRPGLIGQPREIIVPPLVIRSRRIFQNRLVMLHPAARVFPHAVQIAAASD